MNLAVKDVAALLNVSAKTIYRMIRSGTIPCFKVGGQWRFDGREIASWIEDTRAFSYEATVGGAAPDEEGIAVTEFLRRGGVCYGIPALDKQGAIRSCIEAMQGVIPRIDPERLFAAIMDREALCPTAVGDGIALPHPRSIKDLQELSRVVLCFLERPIPFGAVDNEDVDTLFFIFPRSERRFLRIQAKLLRLLRDAEVLAALGRRPPAEGIYEVFSRKEREIFGD